MVEDLENGQSTKDIPIGARINPIYRKGSIPVGLCIQHAYNKARDTLTKEEWLQCEWCGHTKSIWR